MAGTADSRVRDLFNLKICVRPELEFRYQPFGKEASYVIEDRVRSRFYRVGVAEYNFIRQLDGTRTFASCLAEQAHSSGSLALSEQEATTVCRWLLDAGLASGSGVVKGDPGFEEREHSRKRGMHHRILNLLFIRVPICNPNAWLTRAVEMLSWFPNWLAVIISLAVTFVGILQVFVRWDVFASQSSQILASNNWVWLLVMWLVLKFIHELSHGFICKKYGGDVLEFGVLLILFAPIGYTDATTSWRFRSRWQRLHVSMAGILSELFVAGVAACIWSSTGTGLLNQMAYNAIFAAGATTLFFNLNPLMRFDGYYILSDLLDLPNLYSHGAQYVKYLFRKYILGGRAEYAYGGRPKSTFVKYYGVAAFMWRLMIIASILVMASMLFMGAGIIIAIMAISLWFLPPIFRFVASWWRGELVDEINLWRGIVLPVAVLVFCIILAHTIIWPGGVGAPGYVEYTNSGYVRTQVAGFVDEVFVSDGESVKEGQLLLRLRNGELTAERDMLMAELAQIKIRSRRYQQAGKMASFQVERENAVAVAQRLAEKEIETKSLEIRASRDGIIVGRYIDVLVDRWVSVGFELLSVVCESDKRIRLSIAQSDAHLFRTRVGTDVPVRVRGEIKTTKNKLLQVDPRADTHVPSFVLTAIAGGPLSVRQGGGLTWYKPTGDMEFIYPRFSGTVQLSEAESLKLRAGQMAYVKFLTSKRSIADRLHGGFMRWFERIISRARKSDLS